MTEFWDRLMWEPAWNECHHCSSWETQHPAVYEAWLETHGFMVDEEYPPVCVRQALCAECTAYLREHKTEQDGMRLLRLRLLRD